MKLTKKRKERVPRLKPFRPREGPGRPSLYPGKDKSRHLTVFLTPDGWDRLAFVKDRLSDKHSDIVKSVTAVDSVEHGIHRLYKELGGR